MNGTVNHLLDLRSTNPLQDEAELVWLEPVEHLPPYVRAYRVFCRSRKARPRPLSTTQHVVGFTVPTRNSTYRRVFVLEPNDLGAESPCEAYLSGGAPVESKITSTIDPGVEGVDPSRYPGFAELVAQWKERQG